jgi:hypothetical protein
MKIAPQFGDDPEFVRQVELAINGVLRRCSPASLALIKIDNWFGSRWFGFRGKALGALGVTIRPAYHDQERLGVPPFVPERVVSQRRFAGPAFEEIDRGKPVHLHLSSSFALQRKVAMEEPEAALAWYSGNSMANGRGALMVYVPVVTSYWIWFVELERAQPWRITEARGIKPEDLSRLTEEGSTSLAGSLSADLTLQ